MIGIVSRIRLRAARMAVVGAIVAATLTAGAPPASAAGNYYEGQSPYASRCSDDARWVGSYQAWGAWGDVGAYVEIYHSDRCGTAWALAAVPFSAYNGTTVSIWNPGGPSRTVAPRSGAGYVATAMVDDRPWIQTCTGTQVYRYGSWFAWRMGFCY